MGKVTFHHEDSLPKGVKIPNAHTPQAEGEEAENHRLNMTDSHYFAVHNNKVIGHIGIKTEPDDHHGPIINASYVDPEHRGKGIGMGLYSHVLAHEPNVSSDNAREPGADAIWNKLKAKHPQNVSFDKKADRFTWNKSNKMGKSEFDMDSIQSLATNGSQNLYMAYDGDNAGRLVGRAVLANDEAGLTEISSRIALGHEIVSRWVQEQGGKVISGGGDEGNFSIPPGAIDNIEQLRSDYQFTTQLTMTVGAGATLAEAGKSLMAGKFRGKDQVVMYDPTVDSDIAAAQSHISAGQGSEEENKLGDAYLDKEEEAPAAQSHADDCKYCQETPDHDHVDDCKYCQESETAAQDHDHTDDCQYCQESEAAIADHAHTDDCQYCAAKKQIDNHEHDEENCEYCATAEQRAADVDHDHTDDCQYCAAKESPEGQATAAALGQEILTDDPNTQTERNDINGIDDTQMPLGTEMEDGVSHPEGYDAESAPSTMGMAEDAPQDQGPDFANVLQGGLDQHSEQIGREKIVGMVSQALNGFKASKQVLERAKEQAPELYTSTIMMLKAMIEMAKQLGLGADVEQAEQDPVQPQQAQGAAPQEGAAESPQQ